MSFLSKIFSGFFNPQLSKQPLHYEYYDGEKNEGHLGQPTVVVPEHHGLRTRSRSLKVTSEIVSCVSNRFFSDVIGSGLKLNIQANKFFLKNVKEEDIEEYRKLAESCFNIYANSSQADVSSMDNLHQIFKRVYINAWFDGDCLIVFRLRRGEVKVQVIQSHRIVSPLDSVEQAWIEDNKYIENQGVVTDKNGRHVCYYVRDGVDRFDVYKVKKVMAYSRSGRRYAYMYYHTKKNDTDTRGVPAVAHIIESITGADRYKEATIQTAEERAKIVYQIVHGKNSTGEDPTISMVDTAMGRGIDSVSNTEGYELGEKTAVKVQASTNAATVNMPIDAKLEVLSSDNELSYGEFMDSLFNLISASLNCPPEIARMSYNSNYSASKGAVNQWYHYVDVLRNDFADCTYIPFFKLWLEYSVSSRILSFGTLDSYILSKDFYQKEAVSQCKFTGSKMAHIDPLKEAKAVRTMLGDDSSPLISREQASDLLNLGEWYENNERYNVENKEVIDNDGTDTETE